MLLVGFAYLLWLGPTNRTLAIPLARGVGVVNGFSTLLLIFYVVGPALVIGFPGRLLLLLVATILLSFAAIELRFSPPAR